MNDQDNIKSKYKIEILKKRPVSCVKCRRKWLTCVDEVEQCAEHLRGEPLYGDHALLLLRQAAREHGLEVGTARRQHRLVRLQQTRGASWHAGARNGLMMGESAA